MCNYAARGIDTISLPTRVTTAVSSEIFTDGGEIETRTKHTVQVSVPVQWGALGASRWGVLILRGFFHVEFLLCHVVVLRYPLNVFPNIRLSDKSDLRYLA